MKIFPKLCLLLLILTSCKATSQHDITYHPIVLRAKATSLFTENVNWEEVNTKFLELTKNSEDLKDGLQFLVNTLGDKHAAFRSTKDQSVVVSYTGKTGGSDNRNPDFVNEVINDITKKFEYKLLDNNIGYLKVVAIFPGAIAENAKFIRDGLNALKVQGVDKWIVDLRYNGGGDMNPMILGLAPLIGDGFIGGSVDVKGEIHHGYRLEKGELYDNDNLVTEMEEGPTFGLNEKVAVLLSRYTISSGELLAVVFKGRKNTRFIGEETAGYTTGNGWEQVTDELFMTISESVFIDRNRNKYNDEVAVDEFIEFDHPTKGQTDVQVIKAMEWLNKN